MMVLTCSLWRIVPSWENWRLVAAPFSAMQRVRLRISTVWKWSRWEVWAVSVAFSMRPHWCWGVLVVCATWWIDLPALKSVLIGRRDFQCCHRAVLESESRRKTVISRLAWSDVHSTWPWCIQFLFSEWPKRTDTAKWLPFPRLITRLAQAHHACFWGLLRRVIQLPVSYHSC